MGAGSGAFATADISAGTVLTRGSGFIAHEPSKMSVFDEMCRMSTASAEEVRGQAEVLMQRYRNFCPEHIADALITETGWDAEDETLAGIRKKWVLGLEALGLSSRGAPTVGDMKIMGVKLDRNSFFEA